MLCYLRSVAKFHFSSGRLDYSIAFSVVDYIHEEKEYLPWKAATNSLGDVTSRLGSKSAKELYKVIFICTSKLLRWLHGYIKYI